MNIYVQTVKPSRESTDWLPSVQATRKWGVYGKIVDQSHGHGMSYEVEHQDGTRSWYEPRELKLVDPPSRG